MSDKTTEEAAELRRRAEKYYFSEPLVRQLPIMPVMLAYRAGAESLSTTIAQLREENDRYQWVSVEDRLPEQLDKWGDSDFFQVIDNTGQTTAFYNRYKGWIVAHHRASNEPIEVTHWMPLPPPPTESLTPKPPKIKG